MQENIISRKDIQHVGGIIADPQGKGPRPFFRPTLSFGYPKAIARGTSLLLPVAARRRTGRCWEPADAATARRGVRANPTPGVSDGLYQSRAALCLL